MAHITIPSPAGPLRAPKCEMRHRPHHAHPAGRASDRTISRPDRSLLISSSSAGNTPTCFTRPCSYKAAIRLGTQPLAALARAPRSPAPAVCRLRGSRYAPCRRPGSLRRPAHPASSRRHSAIAFAAQPAGDRPGHRLVSDHINHAVLAASRRDKPSKHRRPSMPIPAGRQPRRSAAMAALPARDTSRCRRATTTHPAGHR